MFTNIVDPRPARIAQSLNDYALALKYNSLTQGFVLGYRSALICYPSTMALKIDRLITKSLSQSIQVILEPDGEGFIARSADLPVYGYGDDSMEALRALKIEIETLYDDLMEDDDFSSEWLNVKQFLQTRVIDEKR